MCAWYNVGVKYLAQTFAYLKKNPILPIAAMLVPSVVACFLSTPYWEVAFVAGFDYDPFKSTGETFALIFGDSWQYFWPVVSVALFQVIGAALLMSAIDRHFRTGRMSLKSPWRLINNSIFTIAIGVIVMSVTSIILRFLLFGLTSFVQAIAVELRILPSATLIIIAAIAVGMFVLHTLIIMPMLFWSPIMFIYGYKFRDAAAMSFKLIGGKQLFIGLLLPLVMCVGVQLLMGFLHVHIAIARTVSFFVVLFTNVYITVFTVIAFYGISELERRDVKPYQMYVMPTPAAQPSAAPNDVGKSGAEKRSKQARPTKQPKQEKHTAQAKSAKPTTGASKPVKQSKSAKQTKQSGAGAKQSARDATDKKDKNTGADRRVGKIGAEGGDVV